MRLINRSQDEERTEGSRDIAEGSTWSDTNRLNMERWTVAGEGALQDIED